MPTLYTALKLTVPNDCDVSKFRYDIEIKYIRHFHGTNELDKIVTNQAFNARGETRQHKIIYASAKELSTITYHIKVNGKIVIRITAKPLTNRGGFSKFILKTTPAGSKQDRNTIKEVNVKKEKEKFIIICGGRGMDGHNVGANFLNCANYHIEEIKKNSFPGVPEFNPNTCEIISHIDVYNMGGYTVFTEDDGTKMVNGIKVLDGYHGKKVPTGEIHRVREFLKIFEHYNKIKYIAYFGHSWVSDVTFKGMLFLGDRHVTSNNTNLFAENIRQINTRNTLLSAQFRFVSCLGSYTGNDVYQPLTELFAQHFYGRECFGWQASGGSVFTHDEHFGHTGIQPSIDPNSKEVNTNDKKSWLAANGKPEGWKMFKK